jgi:hypothetical protein
MSNYNKNWLMDSSSHTEELAGHGLGVCRGRMFADLEDNQSVDSH